MNNEELSGFATSLRDYASLIDSLPRRQADLTKVRAQTSGDVPVQVEYRGDYVRCPVTVPASTVHESIDRELAEIARIAAALPAAMAAAKAWLDVALA